MLKIDTSDVTRVILGRVPTKTQLRSIAGHLADAARGEWIRLAQQELRSTSRDYIAAIGEPEPKKGGLSFDIKLEGALPNMLEKGWPGGDLRETIAHSGAPRAKLSKEGFWYSHIPFRHGTPGTRGRNVGKPMNKKVYSVAQQLGPRERLDHRKVVDPSVAKIIRRKMAKHHAVGRYQGMQKTGGGYFTFRTISEKVPRGWIHPGIRARRLAGKVQKFTGELAKHLIEDAIK